MRVGESVFLHSSPECKGTVSAVETDRFRVTWNAYGTDRPEVLTEKMGVDTRAAGKKARIWYSRGETGNIGFGVPS